MIVSQFFSVLRIQDVVLPAFEKLTKSVRTFRHRCLEAVDHCILFDLA